MGHGPRGESLTRQIQVNLDSKLAIGQSKAFHQMCNGGKSDKIHSWNTYRTYMKHANYFTNWCKENYGCKTLEQCRPHVNEWLESRSNLSPYTQKLESSALAKVYDCKTTDFRPTPERARADITRSRNPVSMDKHFSTAKNADFVDFCKSTGLRRSELKALTGDKLVMKNGEPYIRVDSGVKGGRVREAPVIGNKQKVMDMMSRAGSRKVFDRIPSKADIHSYRAEYASEVYRQHARPYEQIPYDRITRGGHQIKSGVYHCRGDKSGTWLDKDAMRVASNALGHDRLSVIAGHYIR